MTIVTAFRGLACDWIHDEMKNEAFNHYVTVTSAGKKTPGQARALESCVLTLNHDDVPAVSNEP